MIILKTSLANEEIMVKVLNTRKGWEQCMCQVTYLFIPVGRNKANFDVLTFLSNLDIAQFIFWIQSKVLEAFLEVFLWHY